MSKNPCIQCTIRECKYHASAEDYCTLKAIRVGTHEAHPTMVECTDCESFEYKG